jgi:acyl transferase domain-containing protein
MSPMSSSIPIMEPFAIVGYAFKLPQEAEDEAGFWEVLEKRKNVMTEWPQNRIAVDAFYDADIKKPNMVRCFSFSLS